MARRKGRKGKKGGRGKAHMMTTMENPFGKGRGGRKRGGKRR